MTISRNLVIEFRLSMGKTEGRIPLVLTKVAKKTLLLVEKNAMSLDDIIWEKVTLINISEGV